MQVYETSATVQEHGQVRVVGVPFAPGTKVAVTISPEVQSTGTLNGTEDQAQAAARTRMEELFRTVRGFRMGQKIPREELYERGSLR